MKIERLTVQNFLGARAADIALTTPVAVFAGRNFAGKSSLQEAVRMALVGETVRVALKKEYGMLLSEGAESGYISVVADGCDYSVVLPDGNRNKTGEPPAALPFVLDAQRFAALDETARRGFLFGLMGLSAGSAVVRERLAARGCDAAKIEAVLPVLRAGFADASAYAKKKATEAKGAWRALTGETYGEKKAATWKAAKPQYDAAELAKARVALAAVEQQIDEVTTQLGDMQGRARAAQEQQAKLNGLKQQASQYARIQDKLNRDTKERDDWRAKVEEASALSGAAPAEKPLTCPHCSGLVLHRPNMIGAELQPYEQPKTTRDPEAPARLAEYEKALGVMERSVANGQRDLESADAAARALREIEDADGSTAAPTAEEIEALQARKSALQHDKKNFEMGIRLAEEAERAAAAADKKTGDAAAHHADVLAWDMLGDALAPDGIPGEMLAEALTPINGRLVQSAVDAQWPTVRISADMAITSNGRAYSLLSESERWRADAMIAEAVAHLSGIKLLVLDRFDVLDNQGRIDLLEWLDVLATSGEIDTALIFGTLKALPAAGPQSIAYHWIENGVVGAGLKAAA
jgi:hypothetical protein